MDILKKIEEERKKRNWSIYKLSEESGITQSTLANMFARKTNPSINTLIQICDAFEITLSEFFAEPKECNDFHELFVSLSAEKQKLVVEVMKNMK